MSVKNFTKEKISRAKDSGDVSPINLLRETLRKAESGEIEFENLVILGESTEFNHIITAQTTYGKAIELLELAKFDLLFEKEK